MIHPLVNPQNHRKNHRKSPFFMGKLAILTGVFSIASLNMLELPEGNGIELDFLMGFMHGISLDF